MKYLSLFSGIGGFELGLKQAHETICNVDGSEDGGEQADSSYDERQGFLAKEGEKASTPQRPTCECFADGIDERPLCIGFSEIDKYASQIYQQHFPEHKAYGDITKINADELPDFDLLCGGFPCQSFSIAGKRGGFSDTRGTMFFEIARILKAKQPRLLFLENVKGLLSHDEGRTFSTIIATLDELGYDLQWQVLNSKDFGVPQNRERVFIVGHLRGTPRPEVFPFGENGGETDELPRHITNTLTARYEGAQAVGTYIGESKLDAQDSESDRQDSGQNQTRADLDLKPRREKTATRIRRLTPTECERLQGFPDGWTAKGIRDNGVYRPRLGGGVTTDWEEVEISDTQRYKTLGNAVTVNVIKAVAEKLLT